MFTVWSSSTLVAAATKHLPRTHWQFDRRPRLPNCLNGQSIVHRARRLEGKSPRPIFSSV
jgi:hypothetical protein